MDAVDAINNGDAATRSRLKRLKEQWPRNGKRTAPDESAKSSRRALESLNRKLETMRRCDLATEPRTRRPQKLYRQARKLDHLRAGRAVDDDADHPEDGE